MTNKIRNTNARNRSLSKSLKLQIKAGKLASALIKEKDIVSPIKNDWKVNR